MERPPRPALRPGIHETFRLYQGLTRSIARMYAGRRVPPPGASGGGGGALPTFEAFKAQKEEGDRGSTTLHDLWGLMLGALPGLGPDGAQAVLAAHPSPVALWRAYRAALAGGGPHAARGVLAGLRSAGGRAVGQEKSARAVQALYGSL